MQVKTFLLLRAEALEEVFAGWHLVEIGVVGKQAFLVLARSFDVVGADDDITLIMKLMAATVSIRQTLPETTVDRANDCGLRWDVPG